MNDFTKEELEIIAGIIVAAEQRCGQMSASGQSVKFKLQSMIDNYCDHEWDTNLWNHFLSDFECNKCNKNLEEVMNKDQS